ncbi:MAG: galactose mutarotase [Spirochaetaceae bacterium]|nr:galactose mutarotase [Spirochaetaceae bacterium]
MDIKKRKFGVLPDGSKVHIYTISNGQMSFSATNYGCVITSIMIPSKNGGFSDVVFAPPTFDSLVASDASFGAVVGRFANRIGKSVFTLGNKEYKLDNNAGGNCLHGGFFRWDKQLWDATVVETASGTGITFSRLSVDGEQGMPGNLKVNVTYLLNNSNEIIIRYQAVSDADTYVNFTNHSYFNLKGQTRETINNHTLTMNCSSYLETDDNRLPTGKILSVDGTIFDFRKPKALGKDLDSPLLKSAGGYDHCYCIESVPGRIIPFATLSEAETGRTMTVSTDLPGVQLYTANWIGGTLGKNGCTYSSHGAVCIETQFYPDTPNRPEFPTCLLKANETFETTTVYGFRW